MSQTSPEEWFRKMPAVTKAYFVGVLITTTLCSFGFVSYVYLELDFELVLGKFQVRTSSLSPCHYLSNPLPDTPRFHFGKVDVKKDDNRIWELAYWSNVFSGAKDYTASDVRTQTLKQSNSLHTFWAHVGPCLRYCDFHCKADTGNTKLPGD